jgi:hypothetical protein
MIRKLFDNGEAGLLAFDLGLAVLHASGFGRVVDGLPQIRQQGLILLGVREPGDRWIGVLGEGIVLRVTS